MTRYFMAVVAMLSLVSLVGCGPSAPPVAAPPSKAEEQAEQEKMDAMMGDMMKMAPGGDTAPKGGMQGTFDPMKKAKEEGVTVPGGDAPPAK